MSEDSNQEELNQIDYSQLRKHVRYDISSPCVITNLTTNAKTESILLTVSVGGISFIFPEILPTGTLIKIEFNMPNGSSVNKYAEIKRFKREFNSFETGHGSITNGFEHGSKFILLENEANPMVTNRDPIPEVPKEENLRSCFYHLEFNRKNSNILRHGYINRIGDRHILFSTLVELQLGEIVMANMVFNEENNRAEKRVMIEIQNSTKEGKLFSVKGLQLT